MSKTCVFKKEIVNTLILLVAVIFSVVAIILVKKNKKYSEKEKKIRYFMAGSSLVVYAGLGIAQLYSCRQSIFPNINFNFLQDTA